jgi:hypothetical protein
MDREIINPVADKRRLLYPAFTGTTFGNKNNEETLFLENHITAFCYFINRQYFLSRLPGGTPQDASRH